MEHDGILRWDSELVLFLGDEKINKLKNFAELLNKTNEKFNLTGINSINGIIQQLVIGSIEPVVNLNVPRGTVYADIGSGAGIPGIPIGIVHHNLQGVLVESNKKKASFIASVIRDLDLGNLSVYHGRIEEYLAEGARERFDIVFSRALGDPYYVIELGAPLLKTDGLLYIYSHLSQNDLPAYVSQHGADCGLSLAATGTRRVHGIAAAGLLFLKNGNTDNRFPRKISIIKRDIMRHTRSGAT